MANYDDYHVFQIVAEQKNLSKAAETLYLTQPTVSRTIQRLERQLGCQLFIRSKQGVRLTHEGDLLYHHISIANRHIALAEEKLSLMNKLSIGKLHIGVTEMTMQYFLLPFLEQMKQEYPDLQVQLSFEYPGTLIHQLNNGFIDMAILTTPLPEHDSLNITPLSEFQDILIAGEQYFPLAEKKQHLSDLQDQPFVLMEQNTSARAYIDSFFAGHGLKITPEYSIASMPLIVPMVIRNLGIGFVPSIYVNREFFRGDVKRIYLYEEMPKRNICLITSNVFPMSAACKELVSRITE